METLGKFREAPVGPISSLPDEGTTVYDLDIVMSMRKSGVGYDFTTIARTPRYRVAGLEAEVKAMCRPYLDGAKLVSKLPPIRSEAEVNTLLDGEQRDVGDVS